MTFSSQPTEIHVMIAQYCGNNGLINLCLTSQWVNERCLPVLYHHVDLDRFQPRSDCTVESLSHQMLDEFKRLKRLVDTLLSHPEYGEHVRSFKGSLCTNAVTFCTTTVGKVIYSLEEEEYSAGNLWSAMQSLTRVRSVYVGTINAVTNYLMGPPRQIPSPLFQSATSVKLVGRIGYSLAKSILLAINPAMLIFLCLELVENCKSGWSQLEHMPGDRSEDGKMKARDATSGLLTTLTGRCTALRTLMLRRIGQFQYTHEWHEAAEEASYTEWASFIHSVQGTVERLAFGHAAKSSAEPIFRNHPSTVMDGRFQRLVLPAIVSGICLA